LQRENVARRAELDTGNKTIADLQRQLGILNEQKVQEQQAAQQQAAQQQAAQQQQQAAQQRAAQQQQQAAQAAESQRLNELQEAANREAQVRMKVDQDRFYRAQGYVPSGVGWIKHENPDAAWIRARLAPRR